MNDIEFSLSISQEIGSQYQVAKARHAAGLHGDSLVQIRGFCHLICEWIAHNENPLVSYDERDLEKKINHLFKMNWIDKTSRYHLNQLRLNGNKGAHPESFTKSEDKEEQLEKLAAKSMEIAGKLLELCYQRLNPHNPLPTYEVSVEDKYNLKDVCYQAMLERDPEARYSIGMKLLAQSDELVIKAMKDADSGGTGIIGLEDHSLKEQAHFWFKLAANCNHTPSMYKYGLSLTEGFEGEDKKSQGEHFINQASRHGNADANAFIGHCYLRGSKVFEIDLAEALCHLELAAKEDHPVALATLGVMYENGEGVQENSNTAFEYTLRAANAGYPHGQYNLYIFYFNGLGVDQNEAIAIEWLGKAADQGHPKAMLELAKLISDGHVQDKVASDAEALYQNCLSSDSLGNEVRYELALFYKAQWPDWDKLLIAAKLLQECYEFENCESDLAKKCWDISPSIVRLLKDGLKSLNDALFESALITLQLFDSDGHPHKSKQEQYSKFIQKAENYKAAQNTGGQQLEEALSLLIPTGVPRLAPVKPTPLTRKNEKVGRNVPCPCGSGKKYKACCIM